MPAKKNPPAKKPAATKPTAPNSKETYLVAEGVEWINGKKVPGDRKVELTARQALYEKANGRVLENTQTDPA